MDSETRRLLAAEDAIVPDLVDRLERQADELARLRTELDDLHAERETLKTDLTIARRWVHTLALELELADKQLKEARPLLSRIGVRLPEPT
jgi:chromosome segregation ATPase